MCQTFFNKVFFINDDLNDEVFNRIPKTLIIFNGVLNWDGVSKSNDKPKGDHATIFLSWIKKPIAHNSILKCAYAKDTLEGGPMI
jgi:hypothetical protein